MNRFVVLLFGAIMAVGGIGGCAKHVQAPLPTNAINEVDAQLNAVLQAAHAAAVKYEADVQAGFVPSPAFKQTMKVLVDALNIADPLYQTYHSTLQTNPNAPEPAALQQAVAQVSSSLGQIATTANK